MTFPGEAHLPAWSDPGAGRASGCMVGGLGALASASHIPVTPPASPWHTRHTTA